MRKITLMKPSYLLAYVILLCACHNPIKQAKMDSSPKSEIRIDSSIRNYKTLDVTGWQKKVMRNYFVLIPPNYSFNYKLVPSDTASGNILNGSFRIYIRQGNSDMDLLESNNEKIVLLDTIGSLIRKICTYTTPDSQEAFACIYWDTTARTLFKGNYDGVQMQTTKWEKYQIDTIMTIYKSVGKMK